VGAFFGAYASTAIALRVFAGWLPDRIGLKRVLYPAMIVLAIGFVSLSLSHTDLTVTLAGVLCGAGHGYVFPILFALVFERASVTSRGTAAVIFTGLGDTGVLAGAPILGALGSGVGYEAMFRIAATCVGVGLLSFAFWDRDLRIPRRANYTRVTPSPYSPGHDAGDPVTEPGK
jgi:MFS family permease